MTKLSVEKLFLDFGSHEILKNVSVGLERGEVVVCSALLAAARPPCCARSPVSSCPSAARSGSTIR
jgi:hypothetical protein